MNSVLILALIAVAALLGVALVWLRSLSRSLKEAQAQNNPGLQLLQNQMNHMRDDLTKNLKDSAQIIADSQKMMGQLLSESQKTVGERLDRAAQVVGQLQKSVGTLDQKAEQIFAVGKDISSLQEILRAPKLRGVIGELSLGDLLSQILPPKHYTLQHRFKTGEIVDAAIQIGGKLVPVDSKFPLDNFRRSLAAETPEDKAALKRKFLSDVRNHVQAISEKYILPDEGTFDFALMFIMAENVYYETIIRDENMGEEKSLMSYAFQRRVIPVSPNSLYAYLHTILLGLRGLQIEENAKMILQQMARLRGDFQRFRDDFEVLGKHIGNTRTKFEETERRLERLGDKLDKTLEAQGPETAVIADAHEERAALPPVLPGV